LSVATWLDLARQHAPLIAVIAPLIGAALAVLLGHARVSWIVASLASLVSAACVTDLAWRTFVLRAPLTVSAEGIAVSPDGAGLFAAMLISGALALVVLACGAVLNQAQPRIAPLALALSLGAGGGWIGALFASDFVTLAAAVEVGWLASVALTAFGAERDRAALNGALRMLSGGGVAAALLFVGAALIGRGVGSFELAALEHTRIAAPNLTLTGVGLMIVGLALKAGVAPLHMWTGAAFGRGGAWAGMILGAVSATGALAVLMRVASHALGAPAIAGGVTAGLVALGAVSVVIASVQAIGARSLPRLAAYACAAQAGCALISVALGSEAGIAAALVQLSAIVASALALLAGGAAVGGAQALSALDGVGRRAPLAGIALTAGALGLMGAPLTTTFLGRWRMIEAAVGVGWWWAAVAAIAASLAGVFYGGRLVERIYFRRASIVTEAAPRHGWSFAPALIVAVCVMLLGVEPSLLLRAAGAVGALMTGTAP
jgi:formate hydrogenlyase subunit 3/multisubunit Na+/H+ antiporter MnhD subunit